MDKINFTDIEKKWITKFEETQIFKTPDIGPDSKNKYYCLVMFPYPSGRIHMGHVRNYAIGDAAARIARMRGKHVLHPIGWDAFGLPAENAAIERGVHPAEWTFANIDAMRAQLKRLGLSYDWHREICTAKPDYYRWGQWFFLKMYEQGLVYKKNSYVNWCPRCNTVLANEQVEDGTCWRHADVKVEKKPMEQWFFRITKYADELLEHHAQLTGWPENVLTMQKNWIGKSRGLTVNFKVNGADFPIFTTRPDTIYGVTFMAIAFNHPRLKEYIDPSADKAGIEAFIAKSGVLNQNADYEKEGIFTGTYAVNPFNGSKIPLYIANFVLAEYGTGAIMAVPAHDQRDFDFAKKYGIPVHVVIQNSENSLNADTMTTAYTGEGILVNSDQFNGMQNTEAITAISAYAEEKKIGTQSVQYKLKDWLVSRQRYWGNPIPLVYCDVCGIVPVPYNELPVMLPEDVTIRQGENPLAACGAFVNTKCPKCGGPATRETETMDTFTCSSWYYLRYSDPDNTGLPFSRESADTWCPVDQYIGGVEHACMHLLYARFFHKTARDLGLLKTDEPFARLLTQGMVVNNSYYSPSLRKYYFADELNEGPPTCPATGEALVVKMEKMSKSKNNGIDPDSMISRYGADTVRMFTLFAAPPEKDLEWNEKGVEGCHRFLLRVWRRYMRIIEARGKYSENEEYTNNTADTIKPKENSNLSAGGVKARQILHRTIKKVHTDAVERMQYNTAIAALMELLNHITDFEPSTPGDLAFEKSLGRNLIALLVPFAPFIAEELGEMYGLDSMACCLSWPEWDEQFLSEKTFEIVIQINGKIRAKETVPAGTSRSDLIQRAKSNPNIQKYLQELTVNKEIAVEGKLVNFVCK